MDYRLFEVRLAHAGTKLLLTESRYKILSAVWRPHFLKFNTTFVTVNRRADLRLEFNENVLNEFYNVRSSFFLSLFLACFVKHFCKLELDFYGLLGIVTQMFYFLDYKFYL